MKTLLRRLFIDHWPRKLISLVLAIIIWMMMSQTTITKTTPSPSPRENTSP